MKKRVLELVGCTVGGIIVGGLIVYAVK
jgi:hypothetical protein